ncbi:VaFE repeat-containing surface-anchored protein [Winkia neuii]|uniref:VaFE repeat-containing surface-anchored protein n=1 Tax=Winkia neuii TaxID=33007 RepID=UPI0023A95247|nr:VaFE repeat-containing surface-anchored protein [Winkia neuii]WEB72772.1 VaFE repeat-containing surface-anchored protein [Winkia neuii]
MLKSAVAKGEKGKAANYYVYLAAFTSANQMSKYKVAGTITGLDPKYNTRTGGLNFPSYTGTHEEFTELTGFKFEGRYVDSQKLVRVKSIPKQPKDAYITIVNPAGSGYEDAQPVMPVDQPGLPDDGGGSGSNPSTMTPEVKTTVEKLDEHEAIEGGKVITDHVHFKGLVPGKEYILNAELRNKADGSVIGESKEPVKFTPKSSEGDLKDVNGGRGVDIVVNDDVEAGSVDKAVAYEYLTSTEVDASGKDSESGDENKIAEHTDINDDAQQSWSLQKPRCHPYQQQPRSKSRTQPRSQQHP